MLVVAGCGSSDGEVAESGQPAVPATEQASSPSTTSTTVPTTTTQSTAATTAVTATTTTPTVSPAAGEPADGCRRIDDFDADPRPWMIVDDGVMGGRSQGGGTIEDSTLSFFGTVVTAGGGFTSLRLRVDDSELDGTERVRARVRVDDRTYGFTFEDDQEVQGRRISYGAEIPSTDDADADGFAVVEVPFSELAPSIFGRAVNADPFAPTEAGEIGIIISDGIDGDFRLDVDWIDVCA